MAGANSGAPPDSGMVRRSGARSSRSDSVCSSRLCSPTRLGGKKSVVSPPEIFHVHKRREELCFGTMGGEFSELLVIMGEGG